eukprot:502485-Hanusia_phi.AAC.4
MAESLRKLLEKVKELQGLRSDQQRRRRKGGREERRAKERGRGRKKKKVRGRERGKEGEGEREIEGTSESRLTSVVCSKLALKWEDEPICRPGEEVRRGRQGILILLRRGRRSCAVRKNVSKCGRRGREGTRGEERGREGTRGEERGRGADLLFHARKVFFYHLVVVAEGRKADGPGNKNVIRGRGSR